MPDITMCAEKGCPRQASCYRYSSMPSHMQSFSLFHEKGVDCKHFIPIWEGENIKEQGEA